MIVIITIFKHIYRPLLYARYAGHLKHKTTIDEDLIKDEYGTLSMFNIMSPVWSEVLVWLIFFGGIPLLGNRFLVVGLFVLFNWIVSKAILYRLKKENFYQCIMDEYAEDISLHKRYSNVLFNMAVTGAYAFLPILPLILFFEL